MKEFLNCKIVQDLLPLYVEGLTSEASNQAVEAHLDNCRECRDLLKNLREPIGETAPAEVIELDFLKKLRKKYKKIFVCALCLLAALLLLAGAVLVKVFVIGMPMSPDDIYYECQFNEETGELTVHGIINQSMTAYSGIVVKEDPAYVGVLNLEVRGADRLFYNKNYNTAFTETIVIPNDGNDWRVDLVGPSYQRITVWDSFRLEDLEPEELEAYYEPELHVSAEQVRAITADMTRQDIERQLGDTVYLSQQGRMNHALVYIVDEEYAVQIVFPIGDPDSACGLTGEEILAGKVPKEDRHFLQ